VVPLVILCVLLSAGVAYLISATLPRSYEAKATLIVGQSLSATNPDYNQLLVSQRLSTTYAAVATTRPVLKAVIDKLGLDATSDELAKQVRAVASQDSTLLTISAQTKTRARGRDRQRARGPARRRIARDPGSRGGVPASIDADLKAPRRRSSARRPGRGARRPVRTDGRAAAELQSLETRLASLRATYATLLSFASGSAANLLAIVEPAVAPSSRSRRDPC
jgi:uncharacterized protein involved in exopolysaccharide biosynthesis